MINTESVKLFMQASGQQFNYETAELYASLVDEELDEWFQASQVNDEVEEFDACLDTIWVIIGYMLARGWPVADGWAEVERSNLDKIDPETHTVLKRADGKVLKPKGWVGPKLKELLR